MSEELKDFVGAFAFVHRLRPWVMGSVCYSSGVQPSLGFLCDVSCRVLSAVQLRLRSVQPLHPRRLRDSSLSLSLSPSLSLSLWLSFSVIDHLFLPSSAAFTRAWMYVWMYWQGIGGEVR